MRFDNQHVNERAAARPGRRAFLKSAALAAGAALAGTAGDAASGAAATSTSATQPATAAEPETRTADPTLGSAQPAGVYELRTYRFASAEKTRAFEAFLSAAAVPAWGRAGVRPVGIFRTVAKDNPDLKLAEDPHELLVFLPHESAAAMPELEDRLAADRDYQSAGQPILSAGKSDPAFARFESALLRPTIGRPVVTAAPREENSVFELRVYQSPSVERFRNKVDMFNAGEFPVFERAGMPVVFFGGAVAGPDLPQLTYMVLHRDAADVQKNWKAFGADPEWRKLTGDRRYKDNVSKIAKRFLRAAAGSQI